MNRKGGVEMENPWSFWAIGYTPMGNQYYYRNFRRHSVEEERYPFYEVFFRPKEKKEEFSCYRIVSREKEIELTFMIPLRIAQTPGDLKDAFFQLCVAFVRAAGTAKASCSLLLQLHDGETLEVSPYWAKVNFAFMKTGAGYIILEGVCYEFADGKLRKYGFTDDLFKKRPQQRIDQKYKRLLEKQRITDYLSLLSELLNVTKAYEHFLANPLESGAYEA